jgi:hypothetical protein
MAFIIQRAADRVAVPWRNGQGVQYEVAADGPLSDGQLSDRWSWRLSTADLLHDVPFSVIAGVNREFCVATGNGVVLTIDGVPHRCGPHSITPFDGGAAVQASIIDGPTKALNLMVKRGSPVRHLRFHVVGESINGVEALVAVGEGAGLIVDNIDIWLDELDAILNLGQRRIVIARGSVVSLH